MGLALLELRDRAAEEVVDDFELGDADLEGRVLLGELVVGFGELEVAVGERGGGAAWRGVAEVEGGEGWGGMEGVVEGGDAVEEVLGGDVGGVVDGGGGGAGDGGVGAIRAAGGGFVGGTAVV